MNDFLKDDTFLARWLAGELSSEELQRFEQDPEFPAFKKLAESSQVLQVPPVDKSRILRNIKEQRTQKSITSAKRRTLPRRIFISAAAIAILLIAYFGIFQDKISTVTSGPGQQIVEELPDGSSVILNAGSKIAFDSKNFIENRSIQLNGEAFFEVQEGNTFTVSTPNGEVKVLGTSFSVYTRDNAFQVACKTGKVQVNHAQEQAILNPGDQVVLLNSKLEKTTMQPDLIGTWQEGNSQFASIPLEQVSKALENQFGITINMQPKLGQEKYTGSFIHSDLEIALKMVFEPMGLSFQKQSENTYTIK